MQLARKIFHYTYILLLFSLKGIDLYDSFHISYIDYSFIFHFKGGLKIKHKKIILTLAMLFVMLLATSTVAAADNVTDNVLNDATNDATVSANENTTNDVTSVEEETDFVQLDEEETLSDSSGTFTNFVNELNMNYGTFNLKKNYNYVESDSQYNNGIPIAKTITINGNGFTIDAKGSSSIFLVSAKNVIIKNITFINTNSNAIYLKGCANCVVANCTFLNTSGDYGGAIYWNGDNGTISDCTFMNASEGGGGSIHWKGNNGAVFNCNFENLSGGAIYWDNSINGTIFKCNFTHNPGGAIRWYKSDNGTVYDCHFMNNFASDGGAIRWYKSNNGYVYNCCFINNTQSDVYSGHGGAIYWEGDNGTVFNCSFQNNTVLYKIFHSYDGFSISSSYGGAIYWNGNNGTIINSFFKNNFAYRGLNIYNISNIELKNNIFATEPVLTVSNYSSTFQSGKRLLVNLTLNDNKIIDGAIIFLKIYKNNVYYKTITCNSVYSGADHTVDYNAQIDYGAIINLDIGVYTFICIAKSSAKTQEYEVVTENATITITKSDSNTTLIINDNDDYVTLNAIISPNLASGKVTFIVNGTEYNRTVSNGMATLALFGLTVGNYTVKAIYNGDNNVYSSTSDNATFIFNKTFIEPEVNIPPLDSPSDDGSISVTLPSDATGTVTLTINDKDYPFDVVNGVAKVFIPDLDNGDYPYTITYSGDNRYSSFVDNGNLKIEKVCKSILAYDMNITYGDEYDFIATFYYADGSPLSNRAVSFFVRNVSSVSELVRTDSNGVAILQLGLKPGEYEIVSYNGQTDESRINKLIVKAEAPKPIDDKYITISSLDGESGTIKLPNDASGTITLDIAGKPYYFTVVNGVCNVKLSELDNGVYGYILIYSGDAKYASFTKTGSFTISKPITPTNQNNSNAPTNQNTPTSTTKKVAKTTISLKAVKVKKSAKKLVLQATLKKGSKALSGKKITFKFNGKKYTAKTNKKGVAKVTIKKKVLKKLKVGKKVKYQASYGKIIVKKTAKIKK